LHFEYFTLAMLSEAPDRTLRMTELARQTNATLPRLSHVVGRLADRGFIERFPCPEDRRATNARLTDAGWAKVQDAAPGHVATVRQHVVDALTCEQVTQLTAQSPMRSSTGSTPPAPWPPPTGATTRRGNTRRPRLHQLKRGDQASWVHDGEAAERDPRPLRRLPPVRRRGGSGSAI
jgi:Transcriptional regulators